MVILECAHVEKYACEQCAVPFASYVPKGMHKFNNFMSNISHIIIKDNADKEVVDAIVAAVRG